MAAVAVLVSAAVLAGSGAHVAVDPENAARDGLVHVRVTGVEAPALSIRIRGGLASGGRWFGWVPLVSTGHGSWRTVLRAPGFLGVYPVDLEAGGHVLATRALVRVLPRGFAGLPAFPTPSLVAEWWARVVPPGASVRSVATWHQGYYTHRDAGFNRLLVVHVDLFGRWIAGGLRGGLHTLYLSIARLGYGAQWRLLQIVRRP